MTGSNWADALRTLEAQLVCPKCRAMNSPTLRPIAVDHRGNAARDACGNGDVVQVFIPDYLKERV